MTTQLVKQLTGTPIVWADATDWPGGGAHGFGDDDYQLDLTALATTKARQGTKGDLGALRAAEWSITVGVELAVAPAAGVCVYYYWSPSASGTAGTGNAGGASGADGAYQDSSEAEWLNQLIYLGCLVATADATAVVQIQTIGRFRPPQRYGMPVVYNVTAQAFHSDAVEMFFALTPIDDQIQGAV
ncbi:hypothetical protein KKF61_08975 [Patescibacteria group bacterium]|nr:hypothetical protein [Patescibacteria group bacterium]